MKLAKKVSILVLAVALLVGLNSCKTQQGCPNNFSIGLSK